MLILGISRGMWQTLNLTEQPSQASGADCHRGQEPVNKVYF